jgi:hypothetical protein
VYGNDATALRQRLVARYQRTGFLGEMRALAFAALAFGGAERFSLS